MKLERLEENIGAAEIGLASSPGLRLDEGLSGQLVPVKEVT
jgi:hypothetical protein